uniref:Cadherin domain-containing protein n=1 Tax=Nothobranchius furzeri TaxID=105023 RepID=A0A8C6K8E3_NOTFU
MEQRRQAERRGRIEGMLFSLLLFWCCSYASGQFRYSISEEVQEGTAVGNIAKDLGLDKNALKERGVRIVYGSNEPPFNRGEDRKTPSLVLEKPLDRESVKTHSLLLTAVDGGKPPRSGNMTIIVNVSDVNDNPPVFSEESYVAHLSENSAVGTTVIQVNATDLDEGSNGQVVYSFGNDVDVRAHTRFDLNPTTGVIVVAGPIDYEESSRYEIDVQASDKGAATLKTDKTIIINIIDLNDNAPEMEVTSFSKDLPEDSKPGTTVALISVKDSDSGLNGKVTCYINQDLPFLLTPSLQHNVYSLVTKNILNREQQSQYNVLITAKDGGEPCLSSEKIIPIVVSDVNDNSPEFTQSPYTFYITENNTPGERLFSVTAQDQDEGSNALISYFLMRNREGANMLTSFLNVNSETGDIAALRSFDFETVKTFQFQVVASDSGSPSLSSNVTVIVFILDQNDNAPVILYPVSSNGSAEGVEEVPRNVNAGHLVTKVRAYDADIGYNGWLLFSLQEVTDHSLFGLDRYTGQIRTLRSFTETDEAEHKLLILVKDNGNFQVVASDSGSPSLSSNVTVNVFILDQNDNAPVILYPEVPRNVNAGHLVTKVRAYDADIGYNGWVLFSLQEVTDHSLFGLDRYTGQIRTLRSFTETDEAEHKLLILVKDNGNVSLSATATVIVKVVEPKEAFAASDVKSSAKDDEETDVTFYLMITLGSVSVLFLISIIVLIAMQCSKSTEYTSKYLQEANYDGTLCHSIQYRSGDKRYMLVGPRMSLALYHFYLFYCISKVKIQSLLLLFFNLT